MTQCVRHIAYMWSTSSVFACQGNILFSKQMIFLNQHPVRDDFDISASKGPKPCHGDWKSILPLVSSSCPTSSCGGISHEEHLAWLQLLFIQKFPPMSTKESLLVPWGWHQFLLTPCPKQRRSNTEVVFKAAPWRSSNLDWCTRLVKHLQKNSLPP